VFSTATAHEIVFTCQVNNGSNLSSVTAPAVIAHVFSPNFNPANCIYSIFSSTQSLATQTGTFPSTSNYDSITGGVY
jgi:hypothetical protein